MRMLSISKGASLERSGCRSRGSLSAQLPWCAKAGSAGPQVPGFGRRGFQYRCCLRPGIMTLLARHATCRTCGHCCSQQTSYVIRSGHDQWQHIGILTPQVRAAGLVVGQGTTMGSPASVLSRCLPFAVRFLASESCSQAGFSNCSISNSCVAACECPTRVRVAKQLLASAMTST